MQDLNILKAIQKEYIRIGHDDSNLKKRIKELEIETKRETNFPKYHKIYDIISSEIKRLDYSVYISPRLSKNGNIYFVSYQECDGKNYLVSLKELKEHFYFSESAIRDIKNILSQKTEDDNSQSYRFEILKRDNYRCQLCGRTAQEDNIKLEIDHKIPRAKGGSNSWDNLWTLCFDCNRGKRDKDL